MRGVPLIDEGEGLELEDDCVSVCIAALDDAGRIRAVDSAYIYTS